MDINQFKDTLGNENFAKLQTYIAELQDSVASARKESASGRVGMKDQIAKLTTLKETLFEKLGITSEEEIETLPTQKGQAETQKQYEARLKKLERDLKEAQDTNAQLDSKYKGSITQVALQKALSKHDLVDAELVADYVKQRVKFENDELVYVDGDKQLSLDDGLATLVKTKPHLLKAAGTGGSGYNPTATTGKTKSFKDMSLDERSALYKSNPSQYEAMKASATA